MDQPSKILVATVGGSCAPIVDSIRYHGPDRVYFICSDDNPHRPGTHTVVSGPGLPCQGEPSIVVQCHLEESQYKIVLIDDPDDLDHCYAVLTRLLASVKQQYPRAKILADYTGATKSLSSGLVIAALDQHVELVLIRGKRHNLKTVTEGMTYPHRVSIDTVAVDRQFGLTAAFEKSRDYSAVVHTIETTTSQVNVPREQRDQIVEHLQLARAFSAWDKFDHLQAQVLIDALSKPVRVAVEKHGYSAALLSIIHSRAQIDPSFGEEAASILKRPIEGTHGFEVVEDLLLNADRRHHQKRYDDATARIYRAAELAGQIFLRRFHDIPAEEVSHTDVPQRLRDEWRLADDQERPLRLGLMKTHQLLAVLDPDGCGLLWDQWSKRIHDAISVRNRSILAHGFRPVTRADYYAVHQALHGYVSAIILWAISRTNGSRTACAPLVRQLPQSLRTFLQPEIRLDDPEFERRPQAVS